MSRLDEANHVPHGVQPGRRAFGCMESLPSPKARGPSMGRAIKVNIWGKVAEEEKMRLAFVRKLESPDVSHEN